MIAKTLSFPSLLDFKLNFDPLSVMDNVTPALPATAPGAASASVVASNDNSSNVESEGPVYESTAVPAVSEIKWLDYEAAAAVSPEAASNGMLADPEKKASDSDSPGSHSGNRENGESNDSGRSLRCSVNRFTPQFKKTQHRRSASPVNWFPRKKADSFLMRKIRHLQEAEGMNLSLDETLGNANPHYTRMAREKIAAREAATKAMKARKAVMVEGSWCRILEAARIQSKEAETGFEKAKKYDVEAFEAARTMGVMIYDRPDCPQRPWEVESCSTGGGGSTHNVTASFETAFEVDKEVAAAVKEAFIRLANCPSYSNKEEFQDLLRKLSENPDNGTDREMEQELKREYVSRLGTELHCAGLSDDDAVNKLDTELKQDFRDLPCKFNENPYSETNRREIKEEFDYIPELHRINITGDAVNKHEIELKQEKHRCREHSIGCNNNSSKAFQELVNMMLDRLKGLQEHELASLAIIVATRGLNAALLEVESGKDHGCESTGFCPGTESLETATRRNHGSTCFLDGHMEGGKPGIKLPGLDKILVKRVSRLEREVQEARNSNKRNSISTHPENTGASSTERAAERYMEGKETGQDLPSLDKILVKHVSRLEREVQEARNSKKSNSILAHPENLGTAKEQAAERFPVRSNNSISTSLSSNSDLGSILVKHVSKLEREIQEAKKLQINNSVVDTEESMETASTIGVQSLPTQKLGEILVNYLSQSKQKTEGKICEKSLHKECKKLKDSQLSEISQSEDTNINESDLLFPLDDGRYDDENIDINKVVSSSTTAEKMHELDMKKMQSTKILPVKRTSRTERVNLGELKVLSSLDGRNGTNEPSGLDNKVLAKHVHRLDREKMQVPLRGNDNTMKRNIRKQNNDVAASEGLDKVLIKHVSRLEKGKLAQGTRQDVVKVNKIDHQVQSMESLGDILVKHQPKLEKAKLAAAQPSEDHIKHVNTFREARDRELQEAWGGLSLGNSIRPRLSKLELDKAAWRRAEEEERL